MRRFAFSHYVHSLISESAVSFARSRIGEEISYERVKLICFKNSHFRPKIWQIILSKNMAIWQKAIFVLVFERIKLTRIQFILCLKEVRKVCIFVL